MTIWRVALDVSEERLHALEALLSSEERARAARYRFEEPRRQFVVCRGTLREILAAELSLAPEAVTFTVNAHGKPALAGDSDLRFNVAHSAQLALIAVARGREVGIDVELVRPMERLAALVEEHFSPAEQAEFATLPAAQRPRAFLTGWVRKEAYMKARGLGFTLPLAAFDVTLAPGAPARLLADRYHADGGAGWALADVAVGPGYVAAMTTQGTVTALQMRDYGPGLMI